MRSTAKQPGEAAGGFDASRASSFPRLFSGLVRRSASPVLLAWALLCAVAFSLATASQAQRRPVEGTRVVVDAPFADATRILRTARLVEERLKRVERALGHRCEHPIMLRYRERVADLPENDRLAFRPWTVAFARPQRLELVLVEERIQPDPPDDLDSVLVHELTHVVLGDLQRKLSGHRRRVPRWLHEGLAQVIAGARYLGGDDHLVWFRARTGRLLSFRSLEKHFPQDEELLRVAYAQSSSFVAWLDRNIGRRHVLKALRIWLRGEVGNLDEALASIDRDWAFTYAEGDWTKDVRKYGLLSFLSSTCFNLLILLAIPLLGIVLFKRFRREERAGERLEDWELRRQEAELDALRSPFDIEFSDDGSSLFAPDSSLDASPRRPGPDNAPE